MHTPHTPARARRRPRLRAMQLLAAGVAFASLAIVGPTPVPASASAQNLAFGIPTATSWDETELFHKINGVRWVSGRSPLYFHGVLGDQASAWSGWMARLGRLVHHPDLAGEASRVTASWRGTAEIVGRGPSVSAVLDGFLASPPHRDKILGHHGAMGVGVVHAGGQLWVTVRFLR